MGFDIFWIGARDGSIGSYSFCVLAPLLIDNTQILVSAHVSRVQLQRLQILVASLLHQALLIVSRTQLVMRPGITGPQADGSLKGRTGLVDLA